VGIIVIKTIILIALVDFTPIVKAIEINKEINIENVQITVKTAIILLTF
jgi:hypothetical protein